MAWDTETTDKQAGGDYDRSIPSAENHLGIMVGLIDLGHHDNTFDNQKSIPRKILFLFEIMDERKPSGDPFVMDQEVNWMPKLGQKSALRKMLEGWRGKPYNEGEKPNLPGLLGKPALLNVIHDTAKSGNPFAKIMTISPPIRGQSIPAPTLAPFSWDLADNGTDLRFPDWLQGRWMPIYKLSIEDYIASSYEGRGLPVPTVNRQPATAAVVGGPDEAGF